MDRLTSGQQLQGKGDLLNQACVQLWILMDNKLLHGSKIALCNTLFMILPIRYWVRTPNLWGGTVGPKFLSASIYVVPTLQKITPSERVHALKPVQHAETPLS